jgi:putative protease
MDAGVDSFKVEGRTKSLYYVSVVARVYRYIIDKIMNNDPYQGDSFIEELGTAGNRGFTDNFIVGKPDKTDYNYDASKGVAGLTFLAVPLSDKISEGKILVRAKNQIKLNDLVEWITPQSAYLDCINTIQSVDGELLEVANTNSEVYLNAPVDLDNCKWAILRSKG